MEGKYHKMNSLKAPLLLAVLCVRLTPCILGCGGDRRESFYPPLPTQTKLRQAHAAGYPTTYFLAVLGPFMRFMKSRHRQNGALLTFFL
ncbi:MAG: hypothetical protein DMG55_30385 [Acidobacteria bacterium]|nr:MAG: hypothetical protein DMG55_30385 [Acidobacteriota bacterium]